MPGVCQLVQQDLVDRQLGQPRSWLLDCQNQKSVRCFLPPSPSPSTPRPLFSDPPPAPLMSPSPRADNSTRDEGSPGQWCGFARPWPLDCTRPGSSFVQSLGFEFYHTQSWQSLLDFILQSFLEHVEQFSNFGSGALITQVVFTTTLHHAVACHRKCWDGKAALLLYPPQGPSERVCHQAAWEPRLHGGLPEGIHSYPGSTGRSTQYHLVLQRLAHCRQDLFLPQEAPLPTRAAGLSECCYNNLPQIVQSGHCCDKLWARDDQALWMVMPRLSTPIVRVVCESWSRSWVS